MTWKAKADMHLSSWIKVVILGWIRRSILQGEQVLFYSQLGIIRALVQSNKCQTSTKRSCMRVIRILINSTLHQHQAAVKRFRLRKLKREGSRNKITSWDPRVWSKLINSSWMSSMPNRLSKKLIRSLSPELQLKSWMTISIKRISRWHLLLHISHRSNQHVFSLSRILSKRDSTI